MIWPNSKHRADCHRSISTVNVYHVISGARLIGLDLIYWIRGNLFYSSLWRASSPAV